MVHDFRHSAAAAGTELRVQSEHLVAVSKRAAAEARRLRDRSAELVQRAAEQRRRFLHGSRSWTSPPDA